MHNKNGQQGRRKEASKQRAPFLRGLNARMHYVRVESGMEMPPIDVGKPFKCVVVIEQKVEPEWQALVSRWICDSGCLYMMAWGRDCSSWDDSVDLANLEQFEDEIPDESFVITTWHENEPLEDVLWFAKTSAWHKFTDLNDMMVLHISNENKRSVLLKAYENA